MKISAGSILVGFSVLSGVLNEWARRFYFLALYNADKILYAPYSPFIENKYIPPRLDISIFGHGVDFFIVLRILIGLVFVLGVALIIYGFFHEKQIPKGHLKNQD